MEPELTSLAMTAAAAVIKVLASDSWELAKTAIGGLWRRIRPDRADAAEAELDDARAALLEAAASGDADIDDVRDGLVVEWRGRLSRLPLGAPQLAGELRRLIEELETTDAASRPNVSMRARASGHGRVYMAGRDMTIEQR